jgi:hypothetical protein
MIVYIYLIATLENIAQPVVTTFEEFKEKPVIFYPDWDNETMKYSAVLLQNPVIDKVTGEIREMTEAEKVKAGLITLSDGQYLDGEEIKTVPQPNPYSTWDNKNNTWVEDKAEKLKYLKELRYQKQQEFVKYKKELEEKEEEKTEFENLGFDITETEERITEIKSEMDLIKTEITKLTKEIRKLEKEVI